jgi:KAP family P-loop domain
MKLFFDLDGFVFVAGLDQQVIERAIEIRYADPRERAANGSSAPTNGSSPGGDSAKSTAALSAAPVSGRDYIKKIFQVPFGLPAVDRSLLPELVSKLVQARKLEPAQRRDLTGRILNHLRYFSDQAGVNPREVKRLINAYTLQAKLMSLKLPRTDPGAKVDLDTILALQVIAFRPDWERIWRRLEADPDGFVGRLNDAIRQGAKGDPVWVDGEPMPPRLVDYVTAGPAKPLLINKRLKAYLFSSQTSHSSDPLILQAQAIVDDLRRFTQDIGEGTDRRRLSEVLHSSLDALKSTLAGATWARDLVPLASWLEREASTLAPTGEDAPQVPISQWADGFRARLDRLENDLRELRDRYSLRAT